MPHHAYSSPPQRLKKTLRVIILHELGHLCKDLSCNGLNGCPKEWRPTVCRHCGAAEGFHRHDHYSRMLYTFEEVLEILIFRFKCKACNRTFGLLPSFVERYQSVAVDVKEQVISELGNGVPLRVIAEQLDFLSTQPYSEKSLWRWKKKWDRMLYVLEPVFWQAILSRVPHLHLPRGSQSPRSSWGWLFLAWEAVRGHFTDSLKVGCLQWLVHLARLQAVTV